MIEKCRNCGAVAQVYVNGYCPDCVMDRLEILDALEVAGVDNWEGYEEAIRNID